MKIHIVTKLAHLLTWTWYNHVETVLNCSKLNYIVPRCLTLVARSRCARLRHSQLSRHLMMASPVYDARNCKRAPQWITSMVDVIKHLSKLGKFLMRSEAWFWWRSRTNDHDRELSYERGAEEETYWLSQALSNEIELMWDLSKYLNNKSHFHVTT